MTLMLRGPKQVSFQQSTQHPPKAQAWWAIWGIQGRRAISMVAHAFASLTLTRLPTWDGWAGDLLSHSTRQQVDWCLTLFFSFFAYDEWHDDRSWGWKGEIEYLVVELWWSSKLSIEFPLLIIYQL
jgi:hypothetical protein